MQRYISDIGGNRLQNHRVETAGRFYLRSGNTFEERVLYILKFKANLKWMSHVHLRDLRALVELSRLLREGDFLYIYIYIYRSLLTVSIPFTNMVLNTFCTLKSLYTMCNINTVYLSILYSSYRIKCTNLLTQFYPFNLQYCQ